MKVLDGTWMFASLLILAGIARAQVPPEIAKQLVEIGRGVCVPETAKVYRPLHPSPPYKGVSISRDISFGPDPKDVLDVAVADKGGSSRPVLIYVSGGAGNKQQGGENGDVFYDNIMLWATKNGMTGVNVQRHPGQAWDDPAKAIGMAVQWVQTNVAKYKGNPERVFIWSQSAGNVPVSTYVAHSELWGPKGIGLKGVVFMSPPAFDILPATPKPVQGGFGACGGAGAPAPAGNTAKGGPGGFKGGDGKGGGRGKADPVDQATQLARSNLPGLINAKIPFFLSVAELDPPNIIAFAETLKDELCKGGHCPTYMVFKDHSHISEVMSPDTADTSVSGPILKWIKSVK
ncbi:MAG: carboxylesterase family protein [Bryobacterales bacterium]|nr:carboxylesterase family protein [Bryobacterales bacterium]MBV9400993.1 carboxylesterase family protein [Bryobacterales bacterium]